LSEEEDVERRARILERVMLARKVRKEFEIEFQNRLITLLTTALGVVAALFWQSAITDTIKVFIPIESGAWAYELLTAFFVTIIAVIIIMGLSSLQKKSIAI
jgi:drug/metabolite transporter (DMT)-like permease